MKQTVICPMCGSTFAAEDGRGSCSACPLHQGCSLVRCPTCGFETVDPSQSRLARLVERIFSSERLHVSLPSRYER